MEQPSPASIVVSRRAAAGVLLVLIAAGCHAAFYDGPAPFALEWRGVDAAPLPSSPVAEALRGQTLHVADVVDARPDATKIGSVQAKNLPVHTTSNVAAFCTQRLSEMLGKSGAKLTDAGASLTLKPELVTFEVIEAGLFNGEVVLRVSALKGDKVVYSGTHFGKSKRWGRSHNPENYNEALSNALFEATKKLLNDDLFAKALGPA